MTIFKKDATRAKKNFFLLKKNANLNIIQPKQKR